MFNEIDGYDDLTGINVFVGTRVKVANKSDPIFSLQGNVLENYESSVLLIADNGSILRLDKKNLCESSSTTPKDTVTMLCERLATYHLANTLMEKELPASARAQIATQVGQRSPGQKAIAMTRLTMHEAPEDVRAPQPTEEALGLPSGEKLPELPTAPATPQIAGTKIQPKKKRKALRNSKVSGKKK